MLSRVACNIYWMARYLERAEDTARLIGVNANLLLDLPHHTQLGWVPLIFITGAEKTFYEHEREPSEANIIQFLIGDKNNAGSILSCLSFARENLRTTRDVVPREAWEQVNSLYLYTRDHLEMGISRRGRYDFLRTVIQGVQQITGLLSGTMTHNAAYDFIRLGRNLERADMTTRILDVRSANLLVNPPQLPDPLHPTTAGTVSQTQKISDQALATMPTAVIDDELDPFENIQWMSVLKSLSAYQMYRQQVRLRVRGPDVLRFLLQDPHFPRAVYHCLGELERCLNHLPRNLPALTSVRSLKEKVQQVKTANLDKETVHQFIDELQIGLGNVHDQVTATYFPH